MGRCRNWKEIKKTTHYCLVEEVEVEESKERVDGTKP